MTTRPITQAEHVLIMKTMNENHSGFFKRNPQIICILTTECSIGCRLGDILKMRLSDIHLTDQGYRVRVVENKTGKIRYVPMPTELYAYLQDYAMSTGRKKDETIFTLTTRAVDKYIKKVCDYLELDNVSSHSWRKLYAMTIYEKTNNDINATSMALLHSSIAITQRYLNRHSEQLEGILQSNCNIVSFDDSY